MKTEPLAPPLVRWGYPLLGVILTALYARTAAPGPTFSDGPEIVTGIVTLGVIHPTGYPLFTLAAHAFVRLLPIDVQPCVKVSIFNALCAAAAAIFTAHVTRATALLVSPAPAGEERGRPGADIAGLFAGAMLGTSPLVWDQVRIPEVYPFHLFLAAWALFSLFRFEVTRKAGFLVMAALAIGFGLAHHVTMVYMLPAALIYALVREPSLLYSPFAYPVVKVGRLIARLVSRLRKAPVDPQAPPAPAPPRMLWAGAKIQRAWALPVVVVVGALPALFYGYLLWANKHTTGLTWGGVNDWDSLYFHMTGKQYTRFMQPKDIGSYIARLSRLPDIFDRQFMTIGTVLLFPGLIAAFRRAWRPALLLLLVILFFIGHGVYYSVGDYQTYFLPAVMALAVFLGVGLDALLRFAAARPQEQRLFATLVSAATVFALTSGSLLYYSTVQKRLPAPLLKVAAPAFVIPFGVLALACAAAAYIAGRRDAGRRSALARLSPGEALLPRFLLASAALPLLPAAYTRILDNDEKQVIGDSYGREIMESAPPGSVVMVQGDGYLFTLWYQAHVMNRGTDAAVIDVGSLGSQWYKRYLTSHYPAPCDPLSPEHARDRSAYEARCKTFRQRIDLGATSAWITMGDRRSKGISAAERQKGSAVFKDWLSRSSGRVPRLPRADARCDEPAFRRGHSKECRCWFDAAKEPSYSEDCVFSAEEGGVVPRERIEVWMQHIVEEHIDERPVFERNLFTHWNGNAGENFRGWNGPDYQRISGEYALVNRGRVNQVLYATEVASPAADACPPERAPLDVTRRSPPAGGPREGRPYRPNEWPTLITASFLTRSPLEGDDNATRSFHAGETARLYIDWFEKFRFDHFAPEKRAVPIRHGIKVCVFDGSGRRVINKTAVSPRKDFIPLKLPADAEPGDYHVAACTVGEVGDSAKLAEELPCQRLILEYPFKVRAGQN